MFDTDSTFLSEKEIRAMCRDIDSSLNSRMAEVPSCIASPSREFDKKLSHFKSKLAGTHRRRHNCDLVLILFDRMSNKCRKPKKEYIRVMFIRGHKNILRHAINNTNPTRKLNVLDFSNQNVRDHWESLKNLCFSHHIKDIADTDTGPLTDGKSKRNTNGGVSYNTFNDQFCKNYFSSEVVRRSWHLYIELIFCDATCDLLSDKFGFRCCSGPHSIECNTKWELLKEYLQFKILDTLGISSCHIDADLPYQELNFDAHAEINVI